MTRLRTFLLIAALAVLWGLLVSTPALAQDIDLNDTAAELRLDALTVTLLVSTVIPILNGILTTLRTSSTVKAVLTIILEAVTAIVVQATMVDGSAVFSQQTLVQGLLGLAIAIATYAGVWKPARLTSSLIAVQAIGTGTPIAQLIPGRLANVGIK